MQKKKLSKEERNLLSVAYKNVVGSRRASWRVLHSIQDQSDPEVVAKKALVLAYRTEIENELEEICNDILDLLDKPLLAADEISDEAQVFYYKMKGDYLRYLAEVQTASPAGGDAAPKAKKAFDTAVTELDSLGGSEYKDATLIMQLLRENLTLWQAEGGGDEDPAQVDEDGTAVEDM